MHAAFSIPEIVANIVAAEASSCGFLYNCLFINSLFNNEATRLLWIGCGNRHNFATAGHVTADVFHLAAIARRDHNRAQFYANFIQKLWFDSSGDDDDMEEEAERHGDLAGLRFPILKDAGFYGSDYIANLNTGTAILQYCQPALRSLYIDIASNLDDAFLDEVSRRSPHIEALTLGDTQNNKTTLGGWQRFLKTLPRLNTVDIELAVVKVWTVDFFRALAMHPAIKNLMIPHISDDWLASLSTDEISPFFPRLRCLYASVSGASMAMLAYRVPDLQELTLSFERTSYSQPARCAAQFLQLTELTVNNFGPGGCMEGDDFVHLVSKCPQLRELDLSATPDNPAPFGGLKDSDFQNAARYMGNMEKLRLHQDADRRCQLSWITMLTLGEYCKGLTSLSIPIDFSWHRIFDNGEHVLLPNLTELYFHMGEHRPEDDMAPSVLQSYTDKFATMFPKLRDFRIWGGNDDDGGMANFILSTIIRRLPMEERSDSVEDDM